MFFFHICYDFHLFSPRLIYHSILCLHLLNGSREKRKVNTASQTSTAFVALKKKKLYLQVHCPIHPISLFTQQLFLSKFCFCHSGLWPHSPRILENAMTQTSLATPRVSLPCMWNTRSAAFSFLSLVKVRSLYSTLIVITI